MVYRIALSFLLIIYTPLTRLFLLLPHGFPANINIATSIPFSNIRRSILWWAVAGTALFILSFIFFYYAIEDSSLDLILHFFFQPAVSKHGIMLADKNDIIDKVFISQCISSTPVLPISILLCWWPTDAITMLKTPLQHCCISYHDGCSTPFCYCFLHHTF